MNRSYAKNALFFRGLNPFVKNQFKVTCVRRGDTMTEVIEALMRFYNTNPGSINKELKLVQAKRKK